VSMGSIRVGGFRWANGFWLTLPPLIWIKIYFVHSYCEDTPPSI